ncbi:flagellar protein FliT [Solibacillus sp. FSL K6-1126]|uniref:flagellar protein FliT n=1 Tax=Solibacillus sp. FSL K6-1126 TaxID=2921463 RepID=UPI0030F7B709
MGVEQQLLQVSAKLFKQLGEVAQTEDRETLLKAVDELLEERGQLIASLQQKNIQLSKTNPQHALLQELDKGIRGKLATIMNEIRQDMKNVQTAKKSEVQYNNPYASVRVMDGKYYDQKK